MATKLNIKTGTGSDDFIDLSAEILNWKVNLGDGNDVLLGGAGNDTVNAGDGDDRITGAGGDDSINGNDGFDTAVYAHSVFDYLNEEGGLDITPLLGNAIAFATPMEGTDTLKNIEALEFRDATYYMDGRNNGPVAQNFNAQTDEDTAVTIDLNGRYVDLDGDSLTLSFSTSSGALVTFDPDTNTLVYDPNGQFEYLKEGEFAIDTLTYQVDDGNGGITAAEISVEVAGVNDGRLISFEDIVASSYGTQVPSTYEGLTWSSSWYVVDGTSNAYYGGSYPNAMITGTHVAYNGWANDVSISSDENFDFESAWITAAWTDQTITVSGYDDGIYLGSQNIAINTSTPTFVEFDDAIFDSVDQVTFESQTTGLGWQFVVDDIFIA